MIYACSDLHGQYKLWEQIKNYLKPEDTLYFLGDAADRGPDGIKIIMEMLEMDNVKYIRGNHDEMLENFLEYKSEKFEYRNYENSNECYNWMYNGGGATMEQFNNLHKKGIVFPIPFLEKFKEKLVNCIDFNLNGNRIILTHAGLDPWEKDEEFLKYIKYYDMYYWNRVHINSTPERFASKEYKNTYVIHGHTPVITHYFNEPKDNPQMVTYADGHKMCIDMGSFITGRVCLLNLETFEPIYFNAEVEKIND